MDEQLCAESSESVSQSSRDAKQRIVHVVDLFGFLCFLITTYAIVSVIYYQWPTCAVVEADAEDSHGSVYTLVLDVVPNTANGASGATPGDGAGGVSPALPAPSAASSAPCVCGTAAVPTATLPVAPATRPARVVRECSNDTMFWLIKGSNVTKSCREDRCEACRSGWLLGAGHCYFISRETKTHNESRIECLLWGSDLAELDTAAKQTFLVNSVTRVSGGHRYWTNLTKSETGRWLWSDGQEVPDSYWRQDIDVHQHNRNSTHKTCSLFNTDPKLSGGDVGNCDRHARFICEAAAMVFVK
ncbi:putative C-type lectin-like protein [Namao virus]|nr:putative C-type lectin-like protein [Namao virus]